jgi:hypothetical protein
MDKRSKQHRQNKLTKDDLAELKPLDSGIEVPPGEAARGLTADSTNPGASTSPHLDSLPAPNNWFTSYDVT